MEIIANKTLRLDKFLQENSSQSRNQIENFIKKIGVEVDGKKIFKCGMRIKEGQRVKFEFQNQEIFKEREISDEVKKLNIPIIYEDDDILIINKPPFLVIHPAPSVKEITLVDWLKYKNFSLSTISGEERHGIVHRIDKETSGALVIAKNNKAHRNLSLQLQNKSMGRYYIAIVTPPLKENIFVNKPIGRNPKNRLKMGVVENGKEAKSQFIKLLLSNNEKNELIGAKLFTGRTHQIRVHLNSLSRAILGDNLYGYKYKIDKIPRVMLHAYIIYLIHPITKKRLLFKANLYKDFENILETQFKKGEVDEKLNKDTFINYFDTL